MIYYTGIGSRKTPNSVLQKMEVYGVVFSKLGYTLRSGAAPGADSAFESGADSENGLKEIYLPWKNFNGHTSNRFEIDVEAQRIAADLYGNRWERLSRYVKLLMSRNIYQVLGQDLDTPSSFVICWTPDGVRNAKDRSRSTGGTGQAISCASRFNIPVFNIMNPIDEDLLLDFIGDLND